MAKVFYFPGTTTSCRMAQKISQEIPHCELILISNGASYGLIEDDVVGVVFPVYYDGLPGIVEAFLQKIQVANTSGLFVVTTRGVLLAKGVKKQLVSKLQSRVSYFQHITMGESFEIDLWKYASVKDKRRKNKQLEVSADKIVKSIMSRVVQRKYNLKDILFVMDRFRRIAKSDNRVNNSDSFFFAEKEVCISCQTCIQSCPESNLQFINQPQWMQKSCQLCYSCYHSCPVKAIQYRNGFYRYEKDQHWNEKS